MKILCQSLAGIYSHMMRKKTILQNLVRKCFMWLAPLIRHARYRCAELYRGKQLPEKCFLNKIIMTKKERCAWGSLFNKWALAFGGQKWKQLSQCHSFSSAFHNSLTLRQLLMESSLLSCSPAVILEMGFIYWYAQISWPCQSYGMIHLGFLLYNMLQYWGRWSVYTKHYFTLRPLFPAFYHGTTNAIEGKALYILKLMEIHIHFSYVSYTLSA